MVVTRIPRPGIEHQEGEAQEKTSVYVLQMRTHSKVRLAVR